MSTLQDTAARRTALTDFDRTLLVEAGAGSGKTAIMAGRAVMMLLSGIEPRNIAAITFTEAAAGELQTRIREFLQQLHEGVIPIELEVALPDGTDASQKKHLQYALHHADELTSSTIHGFCQQLLRPYPVEAGTDPGATILEQAEGDLLLNETISTWLREHLSEDRSGVVAELVWEDPKAAVDLVNRIVGQQQKNRQLRPPAGGDVAQHLQDFIQAVKAFKDYTLQAPIQVPDLAPIIGALDQTAQTMAASDAAESKELLTILRLELSNTVVTKGGTFRRKLLTFDAWRKPAGQPKPKQSDADACREETMSYFFACENAWQACKSAIAGHILTELSRELTPVTSKFAAAKRRSARLDFDDLLYSALQLLRDHEAVRQALAARYRYILVDEFQDTDPIQTEILWRLSKQPGAVANDWQQLALRPGALFLVGDPKQAIYRFRGADVHTYVQARDAIAAGDPTAVLSINTNFRSQPGILDFANAVFHERLSAEGQPGFTELQPFVKNQPGLPQVSRLTLDLPQDEKTPVADVRESEAAAVTKLISHLLGSHQVRDRKDGELRPCQPGDIALLVGVGTQLEHYETALEQAGIPIATQAGKRYFEQQEVQDLVALTRLLADPADTLAFAAFLRGPMVGLSDEGLLDLVDQQVTREGLHLNMDLDQVTNGHAHDIISRLQLLHSQADSTTPHILLTRAIELLDLRPVLAVRHSQRAERAYANSDLYLEQLKPYAVRGLQAAAADLSAAWTEKERTVEGHTDAPENAVSISTMHSSKGLEWPIVIPINAVSRPQSLDVDFTDRTDGVIYGKIFGFEPTGYAEAREREQEQEQLERVRTWYVALTRARDTMVIPCWPGMTGNNWASAIDLEQYLAELPETDVSHYSPDFAQDRARQSNSQTAAVFAEQQAAIAAASRAVTWKAPSRNEEPGPLLRELDGRVSFMGDELAADLPPAAAEQPTEPAPRGGFQRGLILHKLLEEVLTGELEDDTVSLSARAAELTVALGQEPVADANQGLSPAELTACVTRTLELKEVSAVRDRLVPEFPMGYSRFSGDTEEVIIGISDAVAYDAAGNPELVIDWKSDVRLTAETNEQYRAQINAYLQATGAPRGLIVYMTTGQVVKVAAQEAAQV